MVQAVFGFRIPLTALPGTIRNTGGKAQGEGGREPGDEHAKHGLHTAASPGRGGSEVFPLMHVRRVTPGKPPPTLPPAHLISPGKSYPKLSPMCAAPDCSRPAEMQPVTRAAHEHGYCASV
ncbi:hypothetical protein AAFF_G00258470 [Aldrovandia affinis]|uniref:Uncharacterized protein n=1 Tax=Aldrovandia affinis TaxID=143900 RepID=A0AAD7WTF8_9TELE|nr:hypothetical protein AAFF_G00258470 [Aldrovandia affinis]